MPCVGKTTALFAGHFGKYESGNKGKTMFTIEHEFESTVITTLDQEGQHEDVEVHLDNESIFIRQWSEELQTFDLIELSMQQLKDIITAVDLPEGAYYAK
jgi:hypothetical protein